MADNVAQPEANPDEGQLYQQHLSEVWGANWGRYKRAVDSGNVDLSLKIEDEIKAEAQAKAQRAASRANSPQDRRSQIVEGLTAKQGFVYPGVPQGQYGDPGPDQAAQLMAAQDAYARRADRALWAPQVRDPNAPDEVLSEQRGRAIVIPPADEIKDSAVTALRAVRDATPGVAGMTGGPAGAIFNSLAAFRQAPAAVIPAAREAASESLAAREAKGWDNLQKSVNSHYAPGPATPSVPEADARPVMEGAKVMMDYVAKNPYVQAIPGRKGFPTKEEQVKLLEKALEKGAGKLPEPGPWGHDPASIREAITETLRKTYREGNKETFLERYRREYYAKFGKRKP